MNKPTDFSRIPKRVDLVSQTSAILKEAMLRREWEDSLPGEAELARRLMVGRNTIRKALHELTREGLVEEGHPGKRRRVLVSPRESAHPIETSPVRRITILSPYSPESLPPMTLQVVDEVRALLHASGYGLEVRTSRAYHHRDPGAALKKLTSESRTSAWILLQTTAPIQRWFYHSHVPAVILGMPHEGVRIPAVSPDLKAVGRHAAGKMMARGHRSLVLISRKERLAGSRLLEIGVAEACAGRADASFVQLESEPEREEVQRMLLRLIQLSPRPTGLLVEHSASVPTVITGLAQHNLLTPRDYSLVSLFDGPELNALLPVIASYQTDHVREARRLVLLALRAAENGAFSDDVVLLMPKFQSGLSLGNV